MLRSMAEDRSLTVSDIWKTLGYWSDDVLSVCEGGGEGRVTASTLPFDLIHQSAWKWRSAKFACRKLHSLGRGADSTSRTMHGTSLCTGGSEWMLRAKPR
jgi:hypothetical protein